MKRLVEAGLSYDGGKRPGKNPTTLGAKITGKQFPKRAKAHLWEVKPIPILMRDARLSGGTALIGRDRRYRSWRQPRSRKSPRGDASAPRPDLKTVKLSLSIY